MPRPQPTKPAMIGQKSFPPNAHITVTDHNAKPSVKFQQFQPKDHSPNGVGTYLRIKQLKLRNLSYAWSRCAYICLLLQSPVASHHCAFAFHRQKLIHIFKVYINTLK